MTKEITIESLQERINDLEKYISLANLYSVDVEGSRCSWYCDVSYHMDKEHLAFMEQIEDELGVCND